MYTIDAYSVDAMQATHFTRYDRESAYRKARQLAQSWPFVEVRDVRDVHVNDEGPCIASWIDGERQF